MGRALIVFFAGGAGSLARYLVGLVIGSRPFPYATLIVNLVGSFLIGLVFETSIRVASFSPNLRLGLTVGFMGGFTTYSSFNYETTKLATEGQWGRAAIYVGATFIGCVVAGLAGVWLARRFT